MPPESGMEAIGIYQRQSQALGPNATVQSQAEALRTVPAGDIFDQAASPAAPTAGGQAQERHLLTRINAILSAIYMSSHGADPFLSCTILRRAKRDSIAAKQSIDIALRYLA